MNLKYLCNLLVCWSAGLLVCCTLTACGFSPLYGNHSNGTAVAAQLADVHVAVIADEMGQELRNQILDQMPTPSAAPRYQLNVSLSEANTGISIARDATVTRQELRDNVHIELFDVKYQTVVWKQDMSAVSGYNILESQFSNLIGEQDARTRNLDDLAQRIVNEIALYFNRPPGTPIQKPTP